MRAEVEGDEMGLSFGTGRIAAEVGQTVRVVVIVAYRALGIMVLLISMFEHRKR
jgi:hypothetical protein